MKFLATITILFSFSVFANQDEVKKKEGHDKEHQHVSANVDHAHEDSHHRPHDHKAHHPEHDEMMKATKK